MKINFVVVTYHSSEKVADCLNLMVDEANRHAAGQSWTFVDNSEDGSDAAFFRSKLDVDQTSVVLEFNNNPGFAYACNAGASSSAESEWTVFLNPDLILADDTVSRIVQSIEEADGTYQTLAFGMRTEGRLHQGVTFNSFGWFKDRSTDSSEVCFGPSGGAGAYRTDLFLQYRGFLEELFAWGEDAELALRLHQGGVECGTPNLTIGHLGGHSISGSRKLANKKIHWLLRNRFNIAGLHYGRSMRIKFAVYATLVVLAKTPIYARSGGASTAIGTYASGLRQLARRGRN